VLSPFSTLLEAAEELRLLHEKSTLRRVVDSSGDDEAVTGILESLDESLHDYMVCFELFVFPDTDEVYRCCNKWQSMNKDARGW